MVRKLILGTAVLLGIGSADAVEPADTVVRLGEVSVTAAKGSATQLRLEPVASTVVDAGEVKRLNILTMKDVSEVSPNFYIPDYGSRMTSTVYMRGIGARIDQPVIGLNVDNVPFLNKDNYDFDLVDIERIEVLRGPQSTLYGRNTMGGQINIYTISPMRWQGMRAMAEVGSGITTRGHLAWYKRLNRRLAMSVSGYYNHCAGLYTNEYDGSRSGRENSASGRWKTVLNPAKQWMVENTAAVSINRQRGYPYESVETGEINYNDPCHYHRLGVSDGLTARYIGRNFNLTSITSVQYLDDDMTLDQDFLPVSYFTLTQLRKEIAVTQDLIFRGDIGSRYSWLGGVFAFYKRQRMQAPVTFKDYGIEQLIENRRNEYNPTYPIDWCEDSFVLNSDFTNPVWGVAAYHRSTWRAGRWTLEGALRLDFEHNSLSYRSYCSTAYDIMDLTNPANPSLYRHTPVDLDDRDKLSASFTQLLPKISVSYLLPTNQPSTVYLSVAKGYKAGGFNTQMFSDVLQQRIMGLMGLAMNYEVDEIISYKPEHSVNYEAGASLALLDSQLMLEAAAFYIDCRNQQLTMFPAGTTTGRIMTNAGKTRSAGFELSGTYKPSPRWLINMSYGFCDARFVDFSNGIDRFDGKRVPYAPRNTMFAGANYRLPLGDVMSLAFNVNLRGVGSIYWNESNTLRQPFYALLGASVTWEHKNLSVKLWGENLTDYNYSTFYFVSIGNAFLQRGKPATAGITLRLTIND